MHADYVHAMNSDMFLARNLNPMLRVDTSRTGAITRSDAFGVLGEPYTAAGLGDGEHRRGDYDALNLSLEKRYANNWSGRVSYSLSKATGTANDQADKNTLPVPDRSQPGRVERRRASVDRRHILSIGGRTEIPKTGGATLSTTIRYMSGAPFTIFDSSIDADRNGELVDPVPAGTYSGTGAGRAAERRVQGRAQRRDRPRLLPARRARRLAADAWAAHGRSRSSSTSSTSPTARTSTIRRPPAYRAIDGSADAGDLPRADQPARRQRLPASGADRREVQF